MDISSQAQTCTTSLKGLRDLRAASQVQRGWAEDQLANFNLWAESLGVFAEAEFSINHRLAKNKQVSEVIKQLLEALLGNIETYRRAITREPAPQEQTHTADVKDDGSGSSDSVSESDISDGRDTEDVTAKPAAKIQDGIGRLVQLAVRLRREGTRRSNAEAAKYEPKDEDGQPLSDEFQSYVHQVCERALGGRQETRAQRSNGQEPEALADSSAPQYLKDRVERTMLDRWRRVCYRRHHASDLAGPSQKPTAKTDAQKSKAKPIGPTTGNREAARAQPAAPKKMASLPVPSKPMSAATLVSEGVRIDKKADLHPEAAPTITTKIRADQLEFPRAPTVRNGAPAFMCPFCGLPRQTNLLDKRKWQVHVMQDLSPYFCLFEECAQPYQTYETSDDWHNHVKAEHARQSWICQICHSSAIDGREGVFYDEGEFKQHLDLTHPSSMAPEQLALVLQMSCHKEAPIYQSCLFCGFVPEAYVKDVENPKCQEEINTHMQKSHMQYFALTSMPWDIAGADNADSGRVSGSSESGNQSIRRHIMNDSQLEKFESSKLEADRLEADPTLNRLMSAEGSIYAANLIEIRRRWDSKIDHTEYLNTWLRELLSVTGKYDVTDRDEILGTSDTEMSWVEMQKAMESAPNPPPADKVLRAVHDDGSREYVSDHAPTEDMPTHERKHSIALTSVAETNDTNDNGTDSVEDTDSGATRAAEELFLQLAGDGDTQGLAKFLDSRAGTFDLDCRNEHELTALQLAVLADSVESIRVLIDAGCDINEGYDFGDVAYRSATPLYLAVAKQRFRVAEYLVQRKADVNECGLFLGFPIHAACISGSRALVELLLDHVSHLEQEVDVYISRVKEVQSLPHGGGVVAVNEGTETKEAQGLPNPKPFRERLVLVGGTPLVFASLYGHGDIVKILVNRGADVDAWAFWDASAEDSDDVESCSRSTALTLACRAAQCDIVKILLDSGANDEHRDGRGETVAMNAVSGGSLESLKILVSRTLNVDNRREKFSTALHLAAKKGHTEYVRFLLESGIIADALDDDGKTALTMASSEGHCDVITVLLDFAASVNYTDELGKTALSAAAFEGHADAVKVLLKHGASVNHQDQQGTTALLRSTMAKDAASLRLLLDNEAEVDLYDEDGSTALAFAACRNRPEHVTILIERGAKLELADSDGWTPLMVAASWDHADVVNLLIQKGANLEARSYDNGDTPLIKAAEFGSPKAIEVLIDHGADLEAKDNDGSTALFASSEFNEAGALKALIGKGASVDGENNNGDTALIVTVSAGHIECLQLLIKAGASPGKSNRIWELALLLAAKKGNVACLGLLLPKTSPNVRDDVKTTALMLAASNGHKECTRLLLEAGATLDLVDDFGRSAIHHAARQARPECLRLLLERGAHHSSRDLKGRTPLMHVAEETGESEKAECARILLQAGASINDTDHSGRTALWLAAQSGETSVLEALVYNTNDRLDLDATDEEGCTALMLVLTNARKVKALVDGGARIDLRNPKNGLNALAYALTELHCEAAIALMEKGSSLSDVLMEADSSALLPVKEGLDHLIGCFIGAECRDTVKTKRNEVAQRLDDLKRAGDPVVALKPDMKEKLVQWAQRIKRTNRSRPKSFRKVSFAPLATLHVHDDSSETSSGSYDMSSSETEQRSENTAATSGVSEESELFSMAAGTPGERTALSEIKSSPGDDLRGTSSRKKEVRFEEIPASTSKDDEARASTLHNSPPDIPQITIEKPGTR